MNAKTICLIDDSVTSLKKAAEILTGQGYRVLTADNTYSGLGLLKQESVDLVLCDVMIEPLNGFEFSWVVRSQPGETTIPIIYITDRKGSVDKARARFAGGNGYLCKPFTQDELIQIVHDHLPVIAS